MESIVNEYNRITIDYSLYTVTQSLPGHPTMSFASMRSVLKSALASDCLKCLMSLRGDEAPEDILVPDDVVRNAKVVLKAGILGHSE